ncbi:MAG: hypothetical protein EOO59_11520, partial [Hymenobacter sp.]
MHNSYFLLALLGLSAFRAAAQPTPSDTTNARALPSATVVGYGQRLPLRRTAAGVGVIDQTIIRRFNENSLASAVNTLPGVRLEERATASYRISVRGSTLRSPFGVRNVKLYYFDIPFTQAKRAHRVAHLALALAGGGAAVFEANHAARAGTIHAARRPLHHLDAPDLRGVQDV